jgi:hypothetical protein
VNAPPEPGPPSVRLIAQPASDEVPESGAVDSEQAAKLILPAGMLESLWTRAYLERLGAAYWSYLNRISLGLLGVAYEPDGECVVRLAQMIELLRFDPPKSWIDERSGSVEWRIARGWLVAKEGRGKGFLRIDLERESPMRRDGRAEITLRASVRNFYPWLRGSGRFARIGTRLYSATQLRIHVMVTRGFLRSLARLDLPSSGGKDVPVQDPR